MLHDDWLRRMFRNVFVSWRYRPIELLYWLSVRVVLCGLRCGRNYETSVKPNIITKNVSEGKKTFRRMDISYWIMGSVPGIFVCFKEISSH